MTQTLLPKHIAIIMDGSRRWAKGHSLAVFAGHQKIAKQVIRELVEHSISKGIPFLTLWAFSTENWRRSKEEVGAILQLFRQAFEMNAAELDKLGVRLHHIGDLSRFPEDIQRLVVEWEQKSARNSKITVTFAINYGGRDEITRAVQKILAEKKESISEEELAGYLDTAQLPDPDLIIRPGGELRLSGFLPWQSVYSEFYFSDVLMPDFGPAELDKALENFAHRQRRFGG